VHTLMLLLLGFLLHGAVGAVVRWACALWQAASTARPVPHMLLHYAGECFTAGPCYYECYIALQGRLHY
jgi:hypothetical protein